MEKPPFLFKTSVEWTGEKDGRTGSPGKPEVVCTCPPPFCENGRTDLWSPEDFFVSSIEMCVMMTFIWFAERAERTFVSYKSTAKGHVDFVDGKAMFTKVEVFPKITVSEEKLVKKIRLILKGAVKNCLVSASCKTEVVVTPEISVEK
ncbi:OsmC family protein [Candidatus Hydrogenedentota bacterium]